MEGSLKELSKYSKHLGGYRLFRKLGNHCVNMSTGIMIIGFGK